MLFLYGALTGMVVGGALVYLYASKAIAAYKAVEAATAAAKKAL